MSLGQRLQRLEEVEQERAVRRMVERLAKRYEMSVDEVRGHYEETMRRVQRWGIDEEIRHFAAEHDLSEAEVRAKFEQAQREIEAEEQHETAITIEG
jgi:uncharacterized protein YlxP (DUF503 family)